MISSGAIAGRVAVQTSPSVTSKHAELISDQNVTPLARCVRLVQNSHQQLLKQNPEKTDFLAELKKRLDERTSGADMKEGNRNPISQALKPWQLELARCKVEFANSAPERKAAEAKEEARVAAALAAEAAEKAKQKAIEVVEAEKANKAPITLKLGANGIPLPPPPPPPPMNPVPQKSVNLTHGMDKVAAGEQERKLSGKSIQVAVLDELTRKLAERAGNANVMDIKPTGLALKPWQVELARSKAEFANSEPERQAAEAKEEARVAAALAAEAAEKAKQKAIEDVEVEKANRAPVTLKLDANGIPLPPPPPPPPPPPVNHIPREKFGQTRL